MTTIPRQRGSEAADEGQLRTLTFRVTADFRRRVRVAAADRGVSLQRLLTDAAEAYLGDGKQALDESIA